jgi:phage shock protein A
MNILNKILNAIQDGTKELTEAILGSEENNEYQTEIEESKKCLDQSKHDLTKVIAKQVQASKKLESIKTEIYKNEIIVEHSLKKGDEKMAMEAADIVAKLEQQKTVHLETVETYTKQVNELKKTMERAERQLKEYQRQINMVDTTQSVQKATQAITEKLNASNSGISSAKQKLDKIKKNQQNEG